MPECQHEEFIKRTAMVCARLQFVESFSNAEDRCGALAAYVGIVFETLRQQQHQAFIDPTCNAEEDHDCHFSALHSLRDWRAANE